MSNSDVFLGMLRSEYDAPEELPDAFIGLRNLSDHIVSKWRNGTLDADTALTLLSTTILTSTNTTEWTIGAQSGRWYRRRAGTPWHVATPPPAGSHDPAWTASLNTASTTITDALTTKPSPPAQ